jgi:hypothetical protein
MVWMAGEYALTWTIIGVTELMYQKRYQTG